MIAKFGFTFANSRKILKKLLQKVVHFFFFAKYCCCSTFN